MRGVAISLGFMLVLLGAGTLGYVLIEGWSVLDGLYMTVNTLATVGFGETHPLSTAGRLFTIALILGGVATISYLGAQVVGALLSGELRYMLEARRMQKALAELEQHVIICGYGRMGRRVCAEFDQLGLPFVIIERDAEALEGFTSRHGVALHGDATLDDTLRRAGIARARALVTVIASDADNLFVTMSARLLNEKLFVTARTEDEANEAKLRRAGAARVISPYVVSAYRAAQSVVRPTVLDFVEVAMGTQHLELQMEEIRVDATSTLVGRGAVVAGLRSEYGAVVVAIKRGDGKMIYLPGGAETLGAGDVLVVLGPPPRLAALEVAARSTAPG